MRRVVPAIVLFVLSAAVAVLVAAFRTRVQVRAGSVSG